MKNRNQGWSATVKMDVETVAEDVCDMFEVERDYVIEKEETTRMASGEMRDILVSSLGKQFRIRITEA